jgi:L-amino acid N-acyltransferase YncA
MARGLGRLIRSRKPLVPEERLVGWDGQFLPPPTDWEFRPQFYNNTPEYISGFENWLGEVTVRTMSEKSVAELSFGVLPAEQVANLDNHPDGIGFAPRETVLSPSNSERYGHRLVKAIVQSPQNPTDFDGDAKLDLSDPDNARYKDETAQLYITRRMAQIKRVQKEAEQKSKLPQVAECQQQSELDMAAKTQGETAPEIQESNEPPPPITTKNIYLRPAVQADAPGMMEIINWHIANGFRAPELAPISEDDMIERMRVSQHARLPFIVAVERARRTSRPKNRRYPRVNPNHPIQNIDPNYVGVTREELIVGWASASDWGAPDYCECITADLELYVAASCRKSGVGRCLMDALLDATDRGYMKKGGYEFRVAPEMKHLYSGGGGRDLHKLIFQVRSFNQPVQPKQMGKVLHVATKSARLDDREDDYEVWLKDWLESYDFEQEARMKKVGTKHNRFMDVRYLSRETCWQPSEGRIPDYTNGY